MFQMPYRHIRKHMRQMIGDSPKDAEDIEKGDNAKGTYCTCVIPRGRSGGLGCSLSPLGFFLQKWSTKWVRNLSQNAGNGHVKDSNFQNFLGEHDPKSTNKARAFGTHYPPPPFFFWKSWPCGTRSIPGPARSTTCPVILQPWHLC